MTHVAAPPAVVLAPATAVALRRRQSGAQMKALDLLCPFAARNWCQEGIKAFHLATLSATAQIHRIRAVADKMVAKTTFSAILIAVTTISHGGLHLPESRGLERPATTSYGHRDGR